MIIYAFHLCTEMQDLTTRICWNLVKKEGYIAIWQKPTNNDCYANRNAEIQPPICERTDDPDSVWYVLPLVLFIIPNLSCVLCGRMSYRNH